MPRYAARTDRNQKDIVFALRGVGASVQPLHAVGRGVPDLLVGYRGNNILLEVKDGEKPPSRRKLTTIQEEWRLSWRGQCHVVKSADEALIAIGSKSRDLTP